jgi:hypothetical protein
MKRKLVQLYCYKCDKHVEHMLEITNNGVDVLCPNGHWNSESAIQDACFSLPDTNRTVEEIRKALTTFRRDMSSINTSIRYLIHTLVMEEK